MAVRVKIRIQPLKGNTTAELPIEAVALVNSGYEAAGPELIVPAVLAERLGLWPSLPAGATTVEYKTAGGKTSVYRIKESARVTVVVAGRSCPEHTADIVIDPKYDQVLISDDLGERLGITILSLKQGVWRFSDESENERLSEPRQIW